MKANNSKIIDCKKYQFHSIVKTLECVKELKAEAKRNGASMRCFKTNKKDSFYGDYCLWVR